VLGPFTVGKGSKIGSNSVVVKEVPENCSVVGIPGRVVIQEVKEPPKEQPKERPDLEHGDMPDPEAKAIKCMFDQIHALEKKVQDLTARLEEKDAAPKKITSPGKKPVPLKKKAVAPKKKTSAAPSKASTATDKKIANKPATAAKSKTAANAKKTAE